MSTGLTVCHVTSHRRAGAVPAREVYDNSSDDTSRGTAQSADLSRDNRLRRVGREIDVQPSIVTDGSIALMWYPTLFDIYTSRGKDAHALGRLREAKLAGHHIQSLKTPDGMASLDEIAIALTTCWGSGS
jgi:hypothetical protein